MLINKFLYKQRKKNSFDKDFLGSAYVASLLEFFIFYLICVGWVFLFRYAMEPTFPNLFPISQLGLNSIVLVLSLILPTFIAIQRSVYYSMVSNFNTLCSNVVSLFSITSSVIKESKNDLIISFVNIENNSFTEKPKNITKILDNIIELIAIIPYGSFEQNKNNADGSRSIDESNHESNLKLENCLAGKFNKKFIKLYNSNNQNIDVSSYILIYEKYMTKLKENSIITELEFTNCLNRSNNVSSSISSINNTKTSSLTPILMGIVTSIVYIYAFFIPWVLWSEYRFHSLWLYIFFVWPFLGLLSVGRILGNPFREYNTNFFIWNDLKLTAKNNYDLMISIRNNELNKE